MWNKYKDNMAKDILHGVRSITVNPELELCPEIHNEILISLKYLCMMMSGKMLNDKRPMHDAFNCEFEQERQYDANALSQSKMLLFNQQQKKSLRNDNESSI